MGSVAGWNQLKLSVGAHLLCLQIQTKGRDMVKSVLYAWTEFDVEIPHQILARTFRVHEPALTKFRYSSKIPQNMLLKYHVMQITTLFYYYYFQLFLYRHEGFYTVICSSIPSKEIKLMTQFAINQAAKSVCWQDVNFFKSSLISFFFPMLLHCR